MTDKALLLVNMGGPSHLDELEGYLEAIFLDPAILPVPNLIRPWVARLISRRRAPKVAERYELIGGASPLPEWTRKQTAAVREQLDDDWLVEHAFRYSAPTIERALGELAERGVRRARILPLFPHTTDAMTGSVVREARRAAAPLGIAIEAVGPWWSRTDLTALWQRMLLAAVAEAGDEARVLFVAHGIPMRNVRRGEDYPVQVARSAAAVAEALPRSIAWSHAFQSRVGPVAWTQPYLEDEAKRLVESSKPLVVMPLSFVADCLETLFDLDIELEAQLRAAGIERFVRVPAPNDDPELGAILARLAVEPIDAP